MGASEAALAEAEDALRGYLTAAAPDYVQDALDLIISATAPSPVASQEETEAALVRLERRAFVKGSEANHLVHADAAIIRAALQRTRRG